MNPEELRNEVIEAFIAHELGNELKYSNSEYDRMLEELKSVEPDFNPFDYLPCDGDKLEHSVDLNVLTKYSPSDNDIISYWNKEVGKVKTPKYDGSSIVIYYKDGKLSHILSMGDKNTGTVQTDKFRKFVPQEVNKSIRAIRCECLVDVKDYGENARGKANGLVNSKYLQDEVDKLATLICFEGYKEDSTLIPITELNLDPIIINGKIKFAVSPEVDKIDYLDRGFARVHIGEYSLDCCIDGIVYSVDESWGSSWAYKYDYLTSAVTKVTDIIWNKSPYQGWVPVLEIDPVELDGKMMGRISPGGCNKLLQRQLGIGAEVEVAFSKMTIPQVVKVLKGSPVDLGSCECGHKFTESDIVGGQLKCWNPDCICTQRFTDERLSGYLESKKDELIESGVSEKQEILNDFESFIWWLFNVPRFNYETNRCRRFDLFKDSLYSSIIDKDYDEFYRIITDNYDMTEQNSWEVDRSYKAVLNTLYKYLK